MWADAQALHSRMRRFTIAAMVVLLVVASCASSQSPGTVAGRQAADMVRAQVHAATGKLESVLRRSGITSQDALRDGQYALDEEISYGGGVRDKRLASAEGGVVEFDVIFRAQGDTTVGLSQAQGTARLCARVSGRPGRHAHVRLTDVVCPTDPRIDAKVQLTVADL